MAKQGWSVSKKTSSYYLIIARCWYRFYQYLIIIDKRKNYEEDRNVQGLLIKCPEYTVLIILITVLQLPQELFHYVHKGAFIPSHFFILEGRRIVQQVYRPNELANKNFFQHC